MFAPGGTAYRVLVPDELLDALSVEKRERSWGELLSTTASSSFTLVALGSEDRIEGFSAAATPSRDNDASERTGEVAATYVDPGRWRAGVGSALLDAEVELDPLSPDTAPRWIRPSLARSGDSEPDPRS